jgi:ATP-dependent exoDNAse (exonuclease V) beta subunit
VAGAPGSIPPPHELDPGALGGGARALGEPPCEAYREAFTSYRQACTDHHARAAVVLIGELLEAFAAAFAAGKAARAGVDFEDLQLGVRDLFAADDAVRRRWSERFELLMVDEFQDTNRLQLDVLEALERDNLFAVGDEFQSIYGFRGADVEIFRERRAALDTGRVRTLRANFRSPEELLDVLDGAFAPVFGERFAPLVAGPGRPPADPDAELRLFDLGPPAGEPPVELLVTDSGGWEAEEDRLGLAGHGAPAGRRAEARLVAHCLRAEVDAGRRAGDIVLLVRATGSLRLFEQALEEQGLPTYVVGGRGYWSQEQVRDGLAYLAALANPRDEPAFYGALASPFCGAGADALVLLAEAGRAQGDGPWAALRAAAAEAGAGDGWLGELGAGERERLVGFAAIFAAERERAEREPVESLLERAIARTGYDLAVLARAGGERRLANLRKLMRLAREYERAEGPDLRGFLAYAATQDLAEAREGEAPLESEGLDAVRLMTIHRAKGLEFEVVCVADLGRTAAPGRERLLIGRGGTVGLRLVALGGGTAVKALAYEAIADELDAEEAAEERRLLYVAMTRARERLILSGASDPGAWRPARPGGAPIDWIVPALLDDPAATLTPEDPDRTVERLWDGRTARVRLRLNAPATLGAVLPRPALAPAARPRGAAPGTALPALPRVLPAPTRARAARAAGRLSYSSLQAYGRCPYRFYLERVLRLPEDPAAPEVPAEEPAMDPRLRGSIAHRLLERLDFERPAAPAREAVGALAADLGVELGEAEVADIREVVAAFAASPLLGRVTAAREVRREAPFAFALEPGAAGPLVVGVLDVLATEADGTALIVDYKTDRLEGARPADVVDAGYGTQRAVYALAALRAGAPRAEVAYCFLEAPEEPVRTTFGPEDAPALADRVAELARGVLAEEYPVTERPHRDLCGDCPGRRALCSYDEAMTLRDPAVA